MTPQTNWMPGIIALAVSLLCGIGYLLLQRGKGGAAPSPEPQKDGVRDDLERRAQSLIEQLKELVAEKHNFSPEQFQAEKSRLEREAAAALRARDEYLQKRKPGTAGTPAPRAAPRPARPGSHGLRGAQPAAGGRAVGRGHRDLLRHAGLPAGVRAARARRGHGGHGPDPARAVRHGPAAAAGADASAGGPRSAPRPWSGCAANPNDLEASGCVGHEHASATGSSTRRERVTKKALAVDPFHIESRVHLGVLHAIRGDAPGAEQELLELVDTYPGAQEALLFLGFINLQSGNRPKALEYFERFTVEVPRDQQPPGLDSAIAQLRQEAGGAP